MIAEEITAENIDEFKGVVSGPWVGAWVVSDEKGYVQSFGSRETIEKLYEPAPTRFDATSGWLARKPVEVKP